ncbi:hypothetical protein KAR91_41805 [Candidatus Pacearchaeota archaeon]|nr:hypothetical protein [Candidatus Pacearchaeota archaeon]
MSDKEMNQSDAELERRFGVRGARAARALLKAGNQFRENRAALEGKPKVCRHCGRVLVHEKHMFDETSEIPELNRMGIQSLYPWWCPSCKTWQADQAVVIHEEISFQN